MGENSWAHWLPRIEEVSMLKAMLWVTLATAVTGNVLAQESPRNAVVAAQRVGPTKPSKVVSKVRQPVGTPHKVSSFAPRQTNKRVYGDPIQAPIVHSAPAPK
jgi:hypothetical protein